jgi:hypothetical protein
MEIAVDTNTPQQLCLDSLECQREFIKLEFDNLRQMIHIETKTYAASSEISYLS